MLLPGGWRGLRRIWSRAPERDVDAEVAFHLEERAGELMATGVSEAEARAQARSEFGDIATVRRSLVAIDESIVRRRGRSERFHWLMQDLRYVIRSLARTPAFVITVALTLALGLGANAAIFSLLDRLFLRPPPAIGRADQVHRIYRVDPVAASRRSHPNGVPASGLDISSVFSHDDFSTLYQTLPRGVRAGGYATNSVRLGRGDDAVPLQVQYVVGDFFGVLEVAPQRGRLFQGDEQRIETPTALVVISDALWHGRFAGRPDIIGQVVDLGYAPYTIVGVAPRDFRGPDNDAADLWTPMNMMGTKRGGPQWYTGRGTAWIRILARTQDASASAALQHVSTLAFRQSTMIPDSVADARIAPLIETAMPGFASSEVAIATRLAGVAAIVLLIACANVANLFLARGMRRRREIAMRLALGVTRPRLISMLLMESVVVSLIGSAVALVVALWGANALRQQILPSVHWVGAAVDLRVLAFTTGLAVLTGLLAGVVPALRASRPDLAETLKGSARDGVFQRSRVRVGLLIAQSALSVVLLAGAGLFVRSLRSVETEDIGYDSSRVVFAQIDADPEHTNREAEISRRLPELARQLERVPGVEQSGLARMTPMRGLSWMRLFLPSGDSIPKIAGVTPNTSWVSAGFFAAMGMRIVSGRGFTPEERAADHRSIVVNETMANNYGEQSAIGRCLIVGAPGNPCVPIVGIVSDAHVDNIIEKPTMQFYLPLADSGNATAGVIVLRTATARAPQVAARVRQELRAEFSGWAETNVHTMSEDLVPELRPWRTGAALFSAAGLLAFLVAVVGIYSTISYTFAQRTHEIGVRVALGARAANVVQLVVGEGVRVVLIGVVIGIALAWLGGRLVQSMLYQTSVHDPLVLAIASIVLLLVGAGACLIPAWRALRVDPASALRSVE